MTNNNKNNNNRNYLEINLKFIFYLYVHTHCYCANTWWILTASRHFWTPGSLWPRPIKWDLTITDHSSTDWDRHLRRFIQRRHLICPPPPHLCSRSPSSGSASASPSPSPDEASPVETHTQTHTHGYLHVGGHRARTHSLPTCTPLKHESTYLTFQNEAYRWGFYVRYCSGETVLWVATAAAAAVYSHTRPEQPLRWATVCFFTGVAWSRRSVWCTGHTVMVCPL